MTQIRSRKPIINSYPDFNENDDNEEEEENHWYHQPPSTSPPSSLSVNNSFTHQSSSGTMGSWGFDVNRSTNEQILSNTINNQQQITKDQNEPFVDKSLTPQHFKLRTPMLTRHKNGDEFSAVDRLVLGPKRIGHIDQAKVQAEQELIAWQNRMLDREQRINTQSPKLVTKRNEYISSRSSTRQIPTSIRPHSSMSNTTEDQQDHQESIIKSARVIKRYIELLYHLQSFYERITDQLYNGSTSHFLKTNHSIFTNHCRKIAEQLQNCKPIWEEKLSDLQSLLQNISSSQISSIETETTLLQRRSTLLNLFQSLSDKNQLDFTHQSIYSDINRLLYEDKLAVQLQDELSTLLQHQSLLNDFTSLLQWNRQIYSSNEQNRVESILPLLREQMTTTDSYISHVSQQLTELVTKIRSLEKYILSYTNAIPLIDDAIGISQNRWRTDIDPQEYRESRSISMSRFDENLNAEKFSASNKRNHSQLNLHKRSSTRLATVKSAKLPLSSILKSSNRKKADLELEDDDFQFSRSKKNDEVRRTTLSKQNLHEFNELVDEKTTRRKSHQQQQHSIYPNA